MSSFRSDTVYGIKSPAELIKELRAENGLTQRELAYRAGTSQGAIARIESGAEDITWTRLRSILSAMGEEPVLESRRLASRYDFDDLMLDRAMSPEATAGKRAQLQPFRVADRARRRSGARER